ncbi:MAG: hypothetical protein M1294_06855 [Firmicutes bacterium]|jgi:hypothetical protein|uniref:Uncharacterized protein n=1 Tax=Sulfobacillus benefaciens TaxID=453960 RepID=A0A2T2X0K0_9FIRM|nr:hypothetical protein [Bacillota bacterium]MCL5014948.1 hypothetical protein [Bacillota bacterium]PSR28017.1 MAG: hypothetical protein C7B43_10695 [Sulfobacillus benefaciens]
MKRWVATLRFTLGSVFGIVGFGMISLALFPFNSPKVLIGVLLLVIGTFITLGTLSPLRKPPDAPKPKDSHDH